MTSPETKIAEGQRPAGEKAALENLKLAHWVYDNNYQVPVSPTEAYISADNLTSSTKAKQLIRWGRESESAVNPYTGEQDISGRTACTSRNWFSLGPLGAVRDYRERLQWFFGQESGRA